MSDVREYLYIEEAMQMLLQAGVPARWSEYVKRIEDQMGDTYVNRWQINAPGKQFRGDRISRSEVDAYLTAAASGPAEQRIMDAIDERAGWNGRDDAYILKRDDIKQAVRAALAPASEEGA